MYAAGRQGLYPSHPPLSPGIYYRLLVYTFWRGLCLLSHGSSSNQIQGWFFSKTSLQSVNLFLFPCSTEVRLVTRWLGRTRVIVTNWYHHFHLIWRTEESPSFPKHSWDHLPPCFCSVVTWPPLWSLLSDATSIQPSILLSITSLPVNMKHAGKELHGLLLGCHRRAGKLLHTSLGVLPCSL